MMTLDKAKVSKIYRIKGATGAVDKISRRLLELGFTRGERVKVVANSLAKKVSLVEIRGYLVSVRTNLLARIEIE